MGGGKDDASGDQEVNILILRSAVKDLINGREFYERQGEGLGDYFEESLSSDIDSLRLYAGIHTLVHGYHRMLSDKFPFAVYYEVIGSQIMVRAVLDCRRDPTWTRNRLRGLQ